MLRDATGSRLGCLPSETGSSPVRSAGWRAGLASFLGLSVGRDVVSKTTKEGSSPSRSAGLSRRSVGLVSRLTRLWAHHFGLFVQREDTASAMRERRFESGTVHDSTGLSERSGLSFASSDTGCDSPQVHLGGVAQRESTRFAPEGREFDSLHFHTVIEETVSLPRKWSPVARVW